jgi:endonuclease I
MVCFGQMIFQLVPLKVASNRSMTKFGWLLLCLLPLFAIADPRPGYYATAEGKTATNLLAALHVIISTGTTNVPYSSSSRLDTSDALKAIDQSLSDTNLVLLIYSGLTATKASFGLTTGWNREHVWANSYGLDDVEPSFSDLHNLHAIDANVNSSRGNKFYDESQAPITSPAHVEAPGTSTDPDSWQPRDQDLGDVARTVLYMATRYWGDRTNEPRLVVTDEAGSITSSTNRMGIFSTLLYWNALDPVDDWERLRNDRVEIWQGNRNPFVDHPEFVTAVWGDITLLALQRSGTNYVALWNAYLRRAMLESSATITGAWQTASVTITTNTHNGIPMRSAIVVPSPDSSFYRLRLK